jgi:hypothetical protein
LEAQLTGDEFDALEHIRRGQGSVRSNACVGRNAKKLAGLKLIKVGRDERAALTDQGTQVLFLRRCVAALRAVAAGEGAQPEADVAAFLERKSHIVPCVSGGYALTDKGRASLADIDRPA